MQDQVAWVPVKTPERAICKVHRVYDGDVSRVCDLCRQVIVFDTAADLLECLNTVQADQQVVVERIKNGLSLQYDAASSAGYRCVAAHAAKTFFTSACLHARFNVWIGKSTPFHMHVRVQTRGALT